MRCPMRYSDQVRRILLLGIIALLLTNSIPSSDCYAALSHSPGTNVKVPGGPSESQSDDTACCASCFCCHFVVLLDSPDANMLLTANEFVTEDPREHNLQRAMRPSDKPPRV